MCERVRSGRSLVLYRCTTKWESSKKGSARNFCFHAPLYFLSHGWVLSRRVYRSLVRTNMGRFYGACSTGQSTFLGNTNEPAPIGPLGSEEGALLDRALCQCIGRV